MTLTHNFLTLVNDLGFMVRIYGIEVKYGNKFVAAVAHDFMHLIYSLLIFWGFDSRILSYNYCSTRWRRLFNIVVTNLTHK